MQLKSITTHEINLGFKYNEKAKQESTQLYPSH